MAKILPLIKDQIYFADDLPLTTACIILALFFIQ